MDRLLGMGFRSLSQPLVLARHILQTLCCGIDIGLDRGYLCICGCDGRTELLDALKSSTTITSDRSGKAIDTALKFGLFLVRCAKTNDECVHLRACEPRIRGLITLAPRGVLLD